MSFLHQPVDMRIGCPPRGAAVIATLLAIVSASAACNRVDRAGQAARIRAAIESTAVIAEPARQHARLRGWAREFYKARRYEPAWIDGLKPRPSFDEALRAVADAEEHGLNPADYGLPRIQAARDHARQSMLGMRLDEAQVAPADVALTYAWLALADDLVHGRVSAREVNDTWRMAPHDVDLARALGDAIDGGHVAAALDALAPNHPQYRGLQQALATFRAAARQQGDAPVAGDTERASWRVRQLALNLDRWRWMPHDLGERHILVNIPAYEMQVIERDRPALAMRVVVGRSDTQTPVFSDEMTYVVFSPYWNIPESILQKETLPRMVDDPDYLLRNQIEVVRGTGGFEEVVDPASIDWTEQEAVKGLRFRQIPGDENALGLVKFIFPNHFGVYLHDTPADALFGRPERALSHGCIRVEKPAALARYVLHDLGQWTPERITAAMHAGQEQAVRLKTKLPVHIGYWTAWVQADGTVRFTTDPYGVDARQERRTRATATRVAHAN